MTLSAALLGGVFLSGCASWQALPTDVKAEEITWQSLHAVDTAQTVSIARDHSGCYYESVTDPLIGKHPAPAAVIAWSAGWSIVHYGITAWLNEHEHPTLTRVWQALTIGSTARWVVHNQEIGVRAFGPNEDCHGF